MVSGHGQGCGVDLVESNLAVMPSCRLWVVAATVYLYIYIYVKFQPPRISRSGSGNL